MKKTICAILASTLIFSGCGTLARTGIKALGNGAEKYEGSAPQPCAGKVSVNQYGENIVTIGGSGNTYLPGDPAIRELFENYPDSAAAYSKYTEAVKSQDSDIRSGVEFFLTGIYSAMLIGYMLNIGGMMDKYQVVRDANNVVTYAFGGLAAFGVVFAFVSGPIQSAEQKDRLNEAALKYNNNCSVK